MKIRIYALAAISSIMMGVLISQSLPESASASNCSQLNSVKVTSGVKYICKRVSGRLVWQAQRSASIVPTPRPTTTKSTPAPVKAVEWASCNRSGQKSGSGSKGLVCLKYRGSLTWISNAVLNDPYPFQPCLTLGQIANWRPYDEDIALICKREPEGNIWDPISLSQAPNANKKIEYTLTGDYCHWNSLTPYLERLEGSNWVIAGSARLVSKAGCPANTSGIEGKLSAEPGTKVRFSVTTPWWSWLSTVTELGNQSQVLVSGNPPVKITPATAKISYSSNGPAGFRLVSYTEFNDSSIFTFCTCDSRYSFYMSSISAVQAEGAVTGATFSFTPGAGTIVNMGGQEFSITLKRNSFKWDLSFLRFTVAGTPIGVIGEQNFSQNVQVDFSWR